MTFLLCLLCFFHSALRWDKVSEKMLMKAPPPHPGDQVSHATFKCVFIPSEVKTSPLPWRIPLSLSLGLDACFDSMLSNALVTSKFFGSSRECAQDWEVRMRNHSGYIECQSDMSSTVRFLIVQCALSRCSDWLWLHRTLSPLIAAHIRVMDKLFFTISVGYRSWLNQHIR